MNDNIIPEPPKPTGLSTTNPTQDMEFAGVNHMMSVLGTIQAEEPTIAGDQRSDDEHNQVVKQAEEKLVHLANTNLNLVHSASIVFNELRYYDAARLRQYAQQTYMSLLKIIGDTVTVPMLVKGNLPDFNSLAFPLMINPNEITSEIIVSIFHKEPIIEVIFDLNYRSGRSSSYANRFKYAKG